MMSMSRVISDDHDPTRLSTIGKLRTTPLRDLLRGQLTARLDYRSHVDACDLPAPTRKLICQVVQRTRLWRREKVDVARELIVHFEDGIRAGRAPNELAKEFGPAGTAALLIRRAKKRQRPIWWQAWRQSQRAAVVLFGLLLVVYLYFAIPYWTASPAPTVDYLALLNARAMATDPTDRAWPLYQHAFAQLPDGFERGELFARPNDEKWAAYCSFLENHQHVLQLVQGASERSTLGFIVESSEGDQLFDGSLLMISLPYLATLRQLSLLSIDDARRRSILGEDADGRVTDRLLTALRIASHTREVEVLVSDLVAGAIFVATLDAVNELLLDFPDVFSDEDLHTLMREIASFADGSPEIRMELEQQWFDDLLQRTYTDDGAGNGRMTAVGWDALESVSNIGEMTPESLQAVDMLVNPVLTTVVADRLTMRLKMQEMIELLRADAARPPWVRMKTPSVFSRELEAMISSQTARLRYLPIVLLLPAMDRMIESGHLTVQIRDAALTVLAIEQYRREYGYWPESLDALVPTLLPVLPVDMYSGDPLKYILQDGQPLLYSIGVDGIDHGGVPPLDATGSPRIEYARGSLHRRPLPTFEQLGVTPGDWVLWPPVQSDN